MGPIATFADALDMLRRRAPLIAGGLIMGFAVSIWVGLGQVPVYESRETLRVAPPKVSHAMAPTTVSDPIVSQLPMLRRQLLSDPELTDLAEAYELFSADDDLTPQAKADRLRRAVDVTWEPRRPGPVVVATSARLTDPEEARLVAQELAHRLIHLSANIRIAEAKATHDFLRRTERALKRDLTVIEARYAARRQSLEAEGALSPEAETELQGYRRDAARVRAELEEIAARSARAEIGLEIETRRQSERLVVTNPAPRPDHPVHDIRAATIALGGLFSGILAFALAWLMELRHPVIRSAAQMQRMTGIAPIVAIPRLDLPGTRRHGLAARLRRRFGFI